MNCWLGLLLSGGCGLTLVLTAHPIALALTGLMPVVWLAQRSRAAAFATTWVYYLSATWLVVECAEPFLPLLVQRLALWLGCCGLLALPQSLCWTTDRRAALWRAPLAAIVTIVPPLGVIAVANPVAAAGWWLPGFGILGALILIALPALLLRWPKPAVAAFAITSATANLVYVPPSPLVGWKSVDPIQDPNDTDFERLSRAIDLAEASTESVLVFPEAYLTSWTSTSHLFFADRLESLKKSRKTLILGAIAPTSTDNLGNLLAYRNLVIGLGASEFTLDQRIPVPIGMWYPFDDRGVPLRPFGYGVVPVENQKVGVLICWEQLLPWPMLASLSAKPDVIVTISRRTAGCQRPTLLQRLYSQRGPH